MGLDFETFPSLEAQIASVSDDIAYMNHDLDDGFRAHLFHPKDLNNFIKQNEKKIKDNKIKFPLYSIEDIKFRLVRDIFLTKNDYENIMFLMMDEKKFEPRKFYSNLIHNYTVTFPLIFSTIKSGIRYSASIFEYLEAGFGFKIKIRFKL